MKVMLHSPAKLFLILITICLTTILHSQSPNAIHEQVQSLHIHEYVQSLNLDGDMTITLDRLIEINDKHVMMDKFEANNEEYITWLYYMNVRNNENNRKRNSQKKSTKIVRHSGANNSLVFTIQKGNEISYDTLRNTILISDDDDDGFDTGGGFLGIKKLFAKWRGLRSYKNQNLQGDLPKGSSVFLSPQRKGLKCGVLVPSKKAKVKIEISDKNGVVVAILVNDNLNKGWNNYKWKRKDNRRGVYKLSVYVDEYMLSQNFRM